MDDLSPLLPVLIAATKHRGPGRRELAKVFLALAPKVQNTPEELRYWTDNHGRIWLQEKNMQKAIDLVLGSFEKKENEIGH